MQWPLSDNVTVSVISAAGAGFAAWLASRVQRALTRNDALSAGIAAQLGGWENLAQQLREYAEDLDAKLQHAAEDCDRRLNVLREDMRRRDEECQHRLAELERRLQIREA